MKKRIVACPACAGPVEFKLSTSLVTVCDFCRSVVARADKQVKDHGKVADLVETNSPIHRGLAGKYHKKRFEVVGRVQYQHPAGGVWNEWYLRFPQDKVGWLAEAQGKFYLLFERHFSDATVFPNFDELDVGHRFQSSADGDRSTASSGGFVVAEKGIATAGSADGDIPWAFRPNAEHRFADLHGDGDAFGTLEYSGDRPRGFFGHEVSLADLNLESDGWATALPAGPNTPALQVNCPKCGGPLTLHAPDQSQRVTCVSCHSLLDCGQGKLEYLQTLNGRGIDKPLIPLGSIGKLFDTDYTVIGFMGRFVVWEGNDFPWTEYLLYNPAKGFRWLVRNQGHWSFVEAVPNSKVTRQNVESSIDFDGKNFKLYDRGTAHVQFVLGEFNWRVTTEEKVFTKDYIAPPLMLSFETTKSDKGKEENISLGTYLTAETIEEAFHLQDLPRPFGVGTIQPLPNRADVWGMWVCFASLLAVLDFTFVSGAVKQPVAQFHFFTAQMIAFAFPMLMWFGRRSFEVNRWSNSEFSPYAQSE